MINKSFIEQIVEKANDPEVIQTCASHIVTPFKVETWMVVRILEALFRLNYRHKLLNWVRKEYTKWLKEER